MKKLLVSLIVLPSSNFASLFEFNISVKLKYQPLTVNKQPLAVLTLFMLFADITFDEN